MHEQLGVLEVELGELLGVVAVVGGGPAVGEILDVVLGERDSAEGEGEREARDQRAAHREASIAPAIRRLTMEGCILSRKRP